MKNKGAQTKRNEFSKNSSTSQRTLFKIKSDRGKEFYISMFQNFLRANNINHSSRFTDKGPSIAEQVIRTINNAKLVLLRGNTDSLTELPSGNIQHNNTIRHSEKVKPIKASKKRKEKVVFFQSPKQETKTKSKD